MTHSVADMLFPDVRFAHILSLGGRNAAHCRDAPIPQEVSTVFDRLVGPLDALAAILADDGARLGTRLVASHGGKEVRCGAYGVLYPCAFRRDESGQVEFDDGDLELCRADFAAAMTAFLRTCEAASGPILFLRDGLETDLPWDRVSQPAGTSFALDVLMVAIVRRFPALEFRILVSVHDADLQGGEQALDSRVAIVSRPPSGETWGMVFAHLAGRDHAFGGQPSRVPEPVASLQLESASSGASPEALPSYLAARLAEGSATAEQAWKTGSDLWHAHRPNLAGQAFALAYEHGCRDLDFLHDYLTLLTGEAQYRKVADLAASLRREELAERPLVARRLAMVGGHAKLALALPRDHEIALSGARAASPAWLEAPALHRTIARAIEEHRPFSFIRVGDGEARFLLGETGGVDGVLTAEEATAIGGVVWKNWFGEPLEAADPVRRAALAETYRQAVGAADVIGACSPGRLQSDTGHYGYLAWQERWLRRTFAGPHYTDALVHRQLNAEDPFLATLLEGQDALGVISPHPDLAAALGERLRIRRVIGHSVPAEGRLPNAIETRAKGPHFPTVYDKIMATLSVPCRGCVFLVAAGLLGKIYCARIKELGGIALDIGALADAWMGHDTRDGQFIGTPRLEVPLPAPALIRPSAPATDETGPARTILCLSMMKTGSTAIAESLRDAAFGEDVAHLHHLGPLARARLPTLGRPVNEVAARLADPHHRFAVVTCVRDPIARWISEIFHDAAADPAAANLIEDHGAFVAYVEAKKMMDYSTAWFDDSLKTMFGLDFRQHAFDHSRKSLRHDTDRLRLLVLRQEDPAPHKESELGWFLGRDRVSLHRRNERSPGRLASRYLEFRETFVAPERWLDVFYGSEVVRHFYTHEERTMFRERWGPRHAAAAGAAHPEARTASDPRIEAGGPLVLAANGTIETPHSPETVMPHVLPDQDPVLAELDSLRARLRDGHAVDFNDYAYRPRERDWTGSVAANSLRAMFAERRGTYADLLDRFCGFDPFFRAIPVLPASGAPHWENWWLPGLDAVALYGLVATQAPRTYLEIGSGHSTRFVRQAIRDHGLPTRIVSIDPDPIEEIQALCDEVVRLRCEEAPTSLFASLGAGDILFFDGSHRSFQNSDATVFFTEILPSLAPGVIYGIHDIFLPCDYPDSWKERFYNEQYLLMTYLLGGAGGDEVVFPAHHIWREPAYAPLRNRLFLGSRHLDWLTSSFWMRRGPAPRGRA